MTSPTPPLAALILSLSVAAAAQDVPASPAAASPGILLYLSFEHPFRKAR